ncbi:MAG: peptide deformylase, partial [bacterium]
SGDLKLREISKPVKVIDNKVRAIIMDLKDTLMAQKDPEGVGLAAPQIGKNIRIFTTNYKNFRRTVINPEIIESSFKKNPKKKSRTLKLYEGCLSLPNYYGPLKRDSYVKLKYLNEEGEETVEVFRNFPAQIILHEIDHLNGILFIDHLLKQKKPLYQLVGEEWKEVEL